MNLIRMNIYRFIKTKSVYVLLLITAMLIGLIAMDQRSAETVAINQEILQQAGVDSDDGVGLTVGLDIIESVGEMTAEMVGSGIVLVFTAIFASLFSNAERAGGYLKNLNTCSGAKEEIFIAKIVPVMLFVLLEVCIIPMTAKIFGLPGMDIFTKEFIIYTVVQWLLHVAFGVSVLMLMEITRSLVAGMLVGIFAGMGVVVMLVGFVENMLHGNGAISGHMLVQTVRMLMPENIMSGLIPALLTGVISFILYMVLGTLTFKKRDIY